MSRHAIYEDDRIDSRWYATMSKVVTIQTRCRELVEQHGGVRKAARALDMDPGYFLRLADGNKSSPSDEILRKLGLVRVVTYRRKA